MHSRNHQKSLVLQYCSTLMNCFKCNNRCICLESVHRPEDESQSVVTPDGFVDNLAQAVDLKLGNWVTCWLRSCGLTPCNQSWYSTEATKAIASMVLVIALVHLKCSDRNLQFPHWVFYTKKQMPFKNEAYRAVQPFYINTQPLPPPGLEVNTRPEAGIFKTGPLSSGESWTLMLHSA